MRSFPITAEAYVESSGCAAAPGLEALFRFALEASPYAAIVARADGEILLVNAPVERLFGYARSDLIGHTIEMLLDRDEHGGQRPLFAPYEADRDPALQTCPTFRPPQGRHAFSHRGECWLGLVQRGTIIPRSRHRYQRASTS